MFDGTSTKKWSEIMNELDRYSYDQLVEAKDDDNGRFGNLSYGQRVLLRDNIIHRIMEIEKIVRRNKIMKDRQ